MENLLEKLKKKNLIKEELVINNNKQNDMIEKVREEFLENLEEKNKEENQMYIELIEQEEIILKTIKAILKTPKFKRIYSEKNNKIKVDKILKKIVMPNVEVTKASKELNEIYNQLIKLLDDKIKLDERCIVDIKKEVGTKIWNQFSEKFKTDEFLKIYNNEL